MLEKSEDPWAQSAGPAGVEEEEESDEQEEDESRPAGGFFRPCRITTNVSKPRAALMTSCRVNKENEILIAKY